MALLYIALELQRASDMQWCFSSDLTIFVKRTIKLNKRLI